MTQTQFPAVANRGPTSHYAALGAVEIVRSTRRTAADAVAAERERAGEIRKVAADLKMVELGEKHIDAGSTVEQFRAELVDEMAKQAAEPVIDTVSHNHVGIEHAEKRAQAMQDAILHRADPTREPTAAAREYRGLTLMDMARESLELRGERTRGLSREDIATRALAKRSGGYQSTSDFPVILGNVISTTLRAAYEAAPQTFRPFTRVTTVPDFKEVTRAQLGEGPAFDKVNESGEFKRGSVTEAGISYKIATYGRIVGFTRQALINDELDAFNRIPTMLGKAAAQLESDLVWAQLLGNPAMGDGTTLFHASHSNVAAVPTRLTAASAIAALVAGRTAMAKQVGLDGKTVLNIRPTHLIVPVALEDTAAQILGAGAYPTVAELAVPDALKRLEIISEPRLDNGIQNDAIGAQIAGNADQWILAATPGWLDTVELAYLGATNGVVIDTQYGFDVDGVEVKGSLDVGARVIEHRGFYRGN